MKPALHNKIKMEKRFNKKKRKDVNYADFYKSYTWKVMTKQVKPDKVL